MATLQQQLIQAIEQTLVTTARDLPKLNYTDLKVALTGYRDYFRSLVRDEEPGSIPERPRADQLLDRLETALAVLQEEMEEEITNEDYLGAFKLVVRELNRYNLKRKAYLVDLVARVGEIAPATTTDEPTEGGTAATAEDDPTPAETTSAEATPPATPLSPEEQAKLEQERRERALAIGRRGAFRPKRIIPAKPVPKKEAAKIRPAAKAEDRKTPAPEREIYQIRVSLLQSEPEVWRSFLVPAETSLADLHRLLQIAFDYSDEQLHRYKIGYDYFGPSSPDGMDQRELYDGITLQGVFARSFNKLTYTYDFAVSWEHRIVIERILPREETKSYPICTGGERAAPPEGLGKIDLFNDLVEALGDKHHAKHDLATERLGQYWEPEMFLVERVNERLGRLQ